MQRLLAGWWAGGLAGGLAQYNIPNWLEISHYISTITILAIAIILTIV